jgi:site-specific DNA recombinase
VVRIHPRPPNKKNPNLFPIGEGFGFFVFFGSENEGSCEGNKGK